MTCDMFDMLAIIDDEVTQTNSEILHGLLKCRNIQAIDDLPNGFFLTQQWVLGLLLCTLSLTKSLRKESYMFCLKNMVTNRGPCRDRMLSSKCSSRTSLSCYDGDELRLA
ncbi:hypothetical protein TNIN_322721 [Trichonephila inaurata madagascariensis]|uniref:Uncharacterized protein n=1 Tax=Trichonephila inaurata madagascariensis TaxID=2747483 RepID=A0A8X7CG26_9ARAC|nr:hypothetical protein TNIN_322721 [Trichonephila inaurata madagascariensis]